MNALIEFCMSCWVFIWIASLLFVGTYWREMRDDS